MFMLSWSREVNYEEVITVATSLYMVEEYGIYISGPHVWMSMSIRTLSIATATIVNSIEKAQ